jgi:hypothetical protein
MVTLWVGRIAFAALLNDRDLDAAPSEIKCKREADRPRTHNQDRRYALARHDGLSSFYGTPHSPHGPAPITSLEHI